MGNIKSQVMNLCGRKITWNDMIRRGVRVITTVRGFQLTELDKNVITEWGKSEGKKVIFR